MYMSIWSVLFFNLHYVYFDENTQKTDAIQVVKDKLCLYDEKYIYIFLTNKIK